MVATDTVYSDTSAVDSGVKQAQLFVGKESLVSDIYPIRSGKQFVNTFEDNIRKRGAMDKLMSDSAKNEISHKVKDILRAYNINDWQSEPYHQNQNPAEWRYRTIKAWANTIMNRTGAPEHCWLLTLQYVCDILNHMSTASLGGQVPLQVLYGVTPDISIVLLYTFYQPVFYATHDQHFPSESEERAGFWVGFAEHCGDSLTHMILDADSLKIIYRSAVRPTPLKNPNQRIADTGGEDDHQPHSEPLKYPTSSSDGDKPTQPYVPTVFIKSRHDDGPTSSKPLPEFNPDDLVGRTFLPPPGDNGERLRAKVTRKVVEVIEKAEGERVQNLSYILCIVNGKVEEIISYNQLVDHLEAAANEDNEISDDLFKFRALIGHQGPLKPNKPSHHLHPYLGFREITPESQLPLQPKNISKDMMALSMSLHKSISSSAQRLLLPSRNTILRPSTKLLRKGAFMSLTLLTMNQPHLRIPHMRNKLILIHLMMHPQMSLTQSWTTSIVNITKTKT